MKSAALFILLFLSGVLLQAREGMWLPFLLSKLNEAEMKSMGMKISARDIYDVNQGSLKDAVVIFGGGCTGEVVSDKGLVITNHHCGYSAVQALSSVEHNYLGNGFWAADPSGELPCPGLSVTFIIRIDDVTRAVKAGSIGISDDSTRNAVRTANIEAIQKRYKDSTGYDAQIKSFSYDNDYYLFMTEKFTDIRLVGFPPDGVGKFGGDTDNWAWPRHTGDFGVFRIYASSENKPAPYSTSNVPYKPRRSVRINTGGVKENDFTFVYGFPGKTNEYLSSDGVAEVMNTIDPIRIRMRETRLDIMNSAMKSSEALFIKYAAKQAGIANYYKKWKGELQGLRVNNAIDKKRKEEEQFIRWVKQDPARMKKYGQLLNDLHQAYEEQYPFVKKNEYLQEAIGSSDLLKGYGAVKNYLRWMDTTAQPNDNSKQKKALMAFLNNSDAETDEMISTRLFEMYARDMNEERYTSKEEIHRWYQSALIAHESKIDVLLSLGDPTSTRELIQADPAWKAYRYFDSIQLANSSQLKKYQQKLSHLYEQYLEAIIAMKQNKAFYPDANATLRVTYGKVEGVQPADGLSYRYYTTLDGAVAKHNEQVEEFRMPEELLELYRKKEYGKYAIQIGDKKTVPLAFLASNHTTGGNSGSPVFNAKGEMIGTNFDRIWEGTMSDILFDPQLCRNIVLDVRYTLFIIEKLGHARWIIDEMNLVQ